mmetsp:Transcript_9587/g.18793  ORF Transcript_9587/g.18793 Transcript_9587/m.18793 type:complete len:213 (+) Transcript_9587:1268-1906(+)
MVLMSDLLTTVRSSGLFMEPRISSSLAMTATCPKALRTGTRRSFASKKPFIADARGTWGPNSVNSGEDVMLSRISSIMNFAVARRSSSSPSIACSASSTPRKIMNDVRVISLPPMNTLFTISETIRRLAGLESFTAGITASTGRRVKGSSPCSRRDLATFRPSVWRESAPRFARERARGLSMAKSDVFASRSPLVDASRATGPRSHKSAHSP